jgi:DNA invertase Pin-like site-specific DNA recombinase
MVGYARVSTTEQSTDLQVRALAAAGVVVYWEDQLSGAVRRPELDDCLAALQPGDVLCFYKLDRVARSLSDLLGIIRKVEASGASLRSLTEPIETGTPVGRLMVHLLGSFAEFERCLIRERCGAGRVAARARGVRFGVPRRVDFARALELRLAGATYREIGLALGCSHPAAMYAVRVARSEVAA